MKIKFRCRSCGAGLSHKHKITTALDVIFVEIESCFKCAKKAEPAMHRVALDAALSQATIQANKVRDLNVEITVLERLVAVLKKCSRRWYRESCPACIEKAEAHTPNEDNETEGYHLLCAENHLLRKEILYLKEILDKQD
jgi:hypothetical protein